MDIIVVSARNKYVVPVSAFLTIVNADLVTYDESKFTSTVQGTVIAQELSKGVDDGKYRPIAIAMGRDSGGNPIIDESQLMFPVMQIKGMGRDQRDYYYVAPKYWEYLRMDAISRQMNFISTCFKCMNLQWKEGACLVDDPADRILHPRKYYTELQLYQKLASECE